MTYYSAYNMYTTYILMVHFDSFENINIILIEHH